MKDVDMDEAKAEEPIELVIFDIGRVLLRIADNWADAYERAGVVMPGGMTNEKEQMLHRLGRSYESGRIPVDDYLTQVASATGLSEREIRRIYDAWLVAPYPGIHELIDELKGLSNGDSLRTACLSNTNDLHWDYFFGREGPHGLGLEHFDWQFAS
ncbi:MAG: hypothetical protein MI741_04875, partial [Rhodospirillales bacterium]|nr:hypothetical protein [Rhodospirillales bacterium]